MFPFFWIASLWATVYVTGSYANESNIVHNATLQPPVDAIYVIGMKHCQERWNRVFAWAKANNLRITPLYGTHFETIDLRDPPIPITGLKTNDIVMAGQVACTMSHIRSWREAFQKNYSRIIVLEDDVRMSNSLLQRLPRLLASADEGSARRDNRPWHYIYLRMHPTDFDDNRQVWHQELSIALPGWGTAAYILSRAGVRYLLTRITSYSHPLDVQLERLQRGLDGGDANFVALDACGLDEFGDFPVACPDNIHELPLAERGNCVVSGSQSGNGLFGKQLPGVKG